MYGSALHFPIYYFPYYEPLQRLCRRQKSARAKFHACAIAGRAKIKIHQGRPSSDFQISRFSDPPPLFVQSQKFDFALKGFKQS